MTVENKAEKLATRMNKITDEFTKNLDLSVDLDVTGDDIIDLVEEKTQDIGLYQEKSTELNPSIANEIVNLANMVQDFKYVRDTLKENTDNGRRVMNAITFKLLDEDDEKQATLVMAFAELNKAIALNMKLYISSYKEISGVLLNLDKIKKEEAKNPDNPTTVNNTVTINAAISTYDMIKSMGELGEIIEQ